MISVVVIVGLVLTVRSAFGHWNQQRSIILTKIQKLDQQVELESDPSKRNELRAQRKLVEHQLPSWSNVRFGRLGLASLLYFFGLLPSALVLKINCDRFGKSPTLFTATLAQLFGHLGKYVPGKAMVIFMRAAVLKRDEVKALTATVSIFVETFMVMAVGAAIAGVVILPLDVPAWMKWMAVAMSIGAMIPTLPPVVRRVIERFESRMDSRSKLNIDWGWFGMIWLLCMLSWLLLGASFALIVTAIPGSLISVSDSLPIPVQIYSISLASIGLALVVGFASLLPGGAGVRELVLVTIMSLMINPTHSLLSAIAARLVFLAVEIIVGTCCWAWITTDPENRDSDLLARRTKRWTK